MIKWWRVGVSLEKHLLKKFLMNLRDLVLVKLNREFHIHLIHKTARGCILFAQT